MSCRRSPPHPAKLLERRYDEAGTGVALGFPASGTGGTSVLVLGRRAR